MKGKEALVGTWALALILVGWDAFHSGEGFPRPRRFFGVNAAWTLLAVLSLAPPAAPVAAALAAGLDVTLAIAVFTNRGVSIQKKSGGAQEKPLATTSSYSSLTSPIIGAGTALLQF